LPPLPRPFCPTFAKAPSLPESSPSSGPLDWLRRSPRFPQSSGYASRWIIESPRISHPSTPPCLNLRVAPFPRSSGNASDRFSLSFPRIVRVSPVSSIFRQCRGSTPRVAPVHSPLGCAVGLLSSSPCEFPRVVSPVRCPSALPLLCVLEFPLALHGNSLVDDDSPA